MIVIRGYREDEEVVSWGYVIQDADMRYGYIDMQYCEFNVEKALGINH